MKESKHCPWCDDTGLTKTLLESWPDGVWRTAKKKESKCGQCRGMIKIGEKYYDTMDRGSGGIWKTIKVCHKCIIEDCEKAVKPVIENADKFKEAMRHAINQAIGG